MTAWARANKRKIAAAVIFAACVAAGLSTPDAAQKTIEILATLAGLLGG